jgi:hypothetical protein
MARTFGFDALNGRLDLFDGARFIPGNGGFRQLSRFANHFGGDFLLVGSGSHRCPLETAAPPPDNPWPRWPNTRQPRTTSAATLRPPATPPQNAGCHRRSPMTGPFRGPCSCVIDSGRCVMRSKDYANVRYEAIIHRRQVTTKEGRDMATATDWRRANDKRYGVAVMRSVRSGVWH